MGGGWLCENECGVQISTSLCPQLLHRPRHSKRTVRRRHTTLAAEPGPQPQVQRLPGVASWRLQGGGHHEGAAATERLPARVCPRHRLAQKHRAHAKPHQLAGRARRQAEQQQRARKRGQRVPFIDWRVQLQAGRVGHRLADSRSLPWQRRRRPCASRCSGQGRTVRRVAERREPADGGRGRQDLHAQSRELDDGRGVGRD